MSIAAVLLIAVVLILRTIFLKRVPKWTICILWMLVGARLLIPFSLESDFSLIPSVSIEYTGEHNEEKGSVGGFDDLINLTEYEDNPDGHREYGQRRYPCRSHDRIPCICR